MRLKFLLSVATFFVCASAYPLDIYVSPSGSDTKLDGSSMTINATAKTGPFKTLAKAQQKIRDIKAAGQFNQPITVHIGKGTYQLKTPLEFSSLDSGEPGKEIMWEGEKGATLLTGGIQLSSCQAYDSANPEQVLSCPFDAIAAGKVTREINDRIEDNGPRFEVFLNEYRLKPASWPDYNWAHVRTEIQANSKFNVFEALPNFSGDLRNAYVHIFPGNDYFDQYIDIDSLDSSTNQIALNGSTSYKIQDGRRFAIKNFKEALTVPEEWFFDESTNSLMYIPPYGALPKSLVLSVVKNLIILNNISYVNFNNLTFRHSTGNAIVMSKVDNIALTNSEINNVGGFGIYGNNAEHVDISTNKIHDTGLGGVYLVGGDRPTLRGSFNAIDNNTIYNYGAILLMSPGIYVAGVGVNVSHNLIAQAPGIGVQFKGNDHIIEKNEIYSTCESSNDCGAIYSGRDWTFRGNVIQYNYIHDMYGYGLSQVDISKNIIRYTYDGARGIYLDDGLSGTNVIGNILVNAGTNSVHFGNGRDTRIENNIIRTNKKAIWASMYSPYYNWDWNRESLKTMPIYSPLWQARYPELAKPMPHDTWLEGNTIQRNVIISTAYLGYSLRYQMPKETNFVGNNIVWHSTSAIRLDYNIPDFSLVKGGALWSDWVSKGVETNSINADPCISIVGSRVKLTCTNSPVNQLGIKGIPTDIGRTK